VGGGINGEGFLIGGENNTDGGIEDTEDCCGNNDCKGGLGKDGREGEGVVTEGEVVEVVTE